MMRQVLQRRFSPPDEGGSGAGRARLARSRGDRWRCRPAVRGPGDPEPSSAWSDMPLLAVAKGPDREAGRNGSSCRAVTRSRWTRKRPGPLLCPTLARRSAPVCRVQTHRGKPTACHRPLSTDRCPASGPSASGALLELISAPPRAGGGGLHGPGAGTGDRQDGCEGHL